MGLRIQKRIRILPGIRVCVSKSGLSSISCRVPGVSLNFPLPRLVGGREGRPTYSLNIPGTGISWREGML